MDRMRLIWFEAGTFGVGQEASEYLMASEGVRLTEMKRSGWLGRATQWMKATRD